MLHKNRPAFASSSLTSEPTLPCKDIDAPAPRTLADFIRMALSLLDSTSRHRLCEPSSWPAFKPCQYKGTAPSSEVRVPVLILSNLLILSGARTSRGEVSAESKDPYSSPAASPQNRNRISFVSTNPSCSYKCRPASLAWSETEANPRPRAQSIIVVMIRRAIPRPRNSGSV